MKTLIFHPKDPSTDFLKKTYENQDAKIFTEPMDILFPGNFSYGVERLIVVGHGTENGLIDMDSGQILFNKHNLSVFKNLKEVFFIWCYASSFVNKNIKKLKGAEVISTGMFISEIHEADFLGIRNVNQNRIDTSNTIFVGALKKILFSNGPMKSRFHLLKEIYTAPLGVNRVIEYNAKKLYYVNV